MKKEEYKVSGMTCASCVKAIEKYVSKIDGVKDVNVNLISEKMTVIFNKKNVNSDVIRNAVDKAGYTIVADTTADDDRKRKKEEIQLLKLKVIIGILFSIPLFYIAMAPMLGLPIFDLIEPMKYPLRYALLELVLAIPVVFVPLSDEIVVNNGEIVIDNIKHEVRKNGIDVNLTNIEYAILLTFAKIPQKTFTREEIIALSFNGKYDGFDRSIDAHIKNIRKK